jgi:hypothetical protein
MDIFKQFHKRNSFNEYMLYQNQHKPLLSSSRPLLIGSAFPLRGKNALC